MPKIKTVFTCESCGYTSPKWQGQCPNCHEWNSLVESVSNPVTTKNGRLSKAKPAQLKPLSSYKEQKKERNSSGIEEFDRVLGGGYVAGQVILLAGSPGVGKSTLLTQVSKSQNSKNVVYVCGEESPNQIKIRAQRLGYKAENMLMLQETDVDVVCATVESQKDASLVIVDSVQSMTTSDLTGVAGSIGQIRESANRLTQTAKSLDIPMIIVGHINKEGSIAGPKVLEHIVDTVLYLEGDSQNLYRILRTAKNRFGPVSEVGIFEMNDSGMQEVKNPSELFLSERAKSVAGSCVTVVMEGQRPLLFEVQALTTKTAFGYPVRTTSGFNANRLKVLLATIEKHCKIDFSTHDVFVNVAGGFKVTEYAADLAVCMALISSRKNKPLPKNLAAFGEVGLLGEIRKVSYMEKRASEAKKLGFREVFTPESHQSIADLL